MSKNRRRKKRSKVYQGEDAKSTNQPSEPVVHHYSAVVRSPMSQWWFDHKKAVKIVTIVAVVVLFLGWVIASGIGLLINR